MLKDKLAGQGFSQHDKSVSMKSIHFFSVIILIILAVAFIAIYLSKMNYANIFTTLFKTTFLLELIVSTVAVLIFQFAGLIVKFFLLALFNEEGFKAVRLKMIKEFGKPMCASKEPLTITRYGTAHLAYIFITAFLPFIISYFTGDFMFVFTSLLCVGWGSGDIFFFCLLLREKSSSYIIDYDGALNYTIYKKNKP